MCGVASIVASREAPVACHASMMIIISNSIIIAASATTTATTTSHTCVALQCGMQAFAAIVSIALLLLPPASCWFVR